MLPYKPNAVGSFKELPQAMNETKVLELLRETIKRVDALEKLVVKDTPERVLSRPHNYRPIILEVLADGKIWSAYSIAETILEEHPEWKTVTPANISVVCTGMAREKMLTKVAPMTYRINQ